MKNRHPKNSSTPIEVATLGGGCFWCLEAVFKQLDGVIKVEPGYSGGDITDPTYEQVSTGRTGHAEVVQVTFYPALISFHEILEVFFEMHDPTTSNRQGNDVGTQYRSVIFFHDETQKHIAEHMIAELEDAHKYDRPIVTQIEAFTEFYQAEAYHYDYYQRNPQQGYCRVIISPKLVKLRSKFLEKLKGQKEE
ncbi:MAG: peptide-methionine (S)-S-oxide reductase MsrA [Promethearchaeota archaeon]